MDDRSIIHYKSIYFSAISNIFLQSLSPHWFQHPWYMNFTSAFIQRYSLEPKRSKRKSLSRGPEKKVQTCIWNLLCCKMKSFCFFQRSVSLLFSLSRKYLTLVCYRSTWAFANRGVRVWYITCCCSNSRTQSKDTCGNLCLSDKPSFS